MKEIEKLEEALALIRQYNNMSFDAFVLFVEKETGVEIPEAKLRDWGFTGLNNIEFYKMFFANGELRPDGS